MDKDVVYHSVSLLRGENNDRPPDSQAGDLSARWRYTTDRSVLDALAFLLEHADRRGAWLPAVVDLSFASARWRQMVLGVPEDAGIPMLHRRHFEVCVFSHLATELKSGDIGVVGSESYADYRNQLLQWEACAPQVADYCRELGLPETAPEFVASLKTWLSETAAQVDAAFPANAQVSLDAQGRLVLKRPRRKDPLPNLARLEAAITARLPERNILDILGNVAHWTNWPRHFGPLSGADPKIERALERYVLTSFTYGCNLGPAQAARHLRGIVTPHMLSFINRRHITATKLDHALRDIINHYRLFTLPQQWGDGTQAAADGTKYELYEQNLLAEYHIRYGGTGGIAYHHIADS